MKIYKLNRKELFDKTIRIPSKIYLNPSFQFTEEEVDYLKSLRGTKKFYSEKRIVGGFSCRFYSVFDELAEFSEYERTRKELDCRKKIKLGRKEEKQKQKEKELLTLANLKRIQKVKQEKIKAEEIAIDEEINGEEIKKPEIKNVGKSTDRFTLRGNDYAGLEEKENNLNIDEVIDYIANLPKRLGMRYVNNDKYFFEIKEV
jgi:hypothetical protein